MFSLDTKMARINKVSLRKEKDENGDEHSVSDIAISLPLENEVLDEFNDKLKPAFYEADANADLVNRDRLPILKFAFPRFPWSGTLEGYKFVAHTGAGGVSEIQLNDAVINKVHFLLQDKATVGTDFIVRARTHPADVGKLSELLDTEVQISLIPPDEKKQYDLEQAKKNRKQALNDHFSAALQPIRRPSSSLAPTATTRTRTTTRTPKRRTTARATLSNPPQHPFQPK